MKTVIFSIHNKAQIQFADRVNTISIPTLDCYAKITTNLSINGQIISEDWGDYSIIDSSVIFDAYDLTDSGLSFTCHHNGVIDYPKLFSWMSNDHAAEKMGRYYEELERSFELENRLSVSLMAGGIIEGLLEETSKKDNFEALINNSVDLNDQQKIIAHQIRDNRNVVHPFKKIDYVSRKTFLESKGIVDKLIYDFAVKYTDKS